MKRRSFNIGPHVHILILIGSRTYTKYHAHIHRTTAISHWNVSTEDSKYVNDVLSCMYIIRFEICYRLRCIRATKIPAIRSEQSLIWFCCWIVGRCRSCLRILCMDYIEHPRVKLWIKRELHILSPRLLSRYVN